MGRNKELFVAALHCTILRIRVEVRASEHVWNNLFGYTFNLESILAETTP